MLTLQLRPPLQKGKTEEVTILFGRAPEVASKGSEEALRQLWAGMKSSEALCPKMKASWRATDVLRAANKRSNATGEVGALLSGIYFAKGEWTGRAGGRSKTHAIEEGVLPS